MTDPQYHVAHLAEPGAVGSDDLPRVFAAAWTTVGRVRLEPGEQSSRVLTDSEAMVYVISGTGTAKVGDYEQPLREGISITLSQGEPLNFEAGPESPLDYFIAELEVGV